MREREGTAFATNSTVREAIKQILPFHPTTAQKRVLGEIADDMRKPQPDAAAFAGRRGLRQDDCRHAGRAGRD